MFLLDTNVISELRKIPSGRANRSVASWVGGVRAEHLYISVITLEELGIGTLLMERRDHRQGQLLRAWLAEHIVPTFRERILNVDERVVSRSAPLHVPDPRGVRDMLISATALVHGMTLVTRDVADMSATGTTVLNPWEWQNPEDHSSEEKVITT